MVQADRRGPASRIPAHELEVVPAPGAVRLAQKRWPKVPGEPNKESEGGHSLLYLPYWAEGNAMPYNRQSGLPQWARAPALVWKLRQGTRFAML